jgi:hypothetical protein
MASVKLTPAGTNTRGTPSFRAEFNQAGDDLPKRPILKSADMLKPTPGIRGFYPRGVDRDAPGGTS